MKIIGIRNKSVADRPTFFFSVESTDMNELKEARDKVQELLGNVEYVDKWHD